MTGLYKIGRSMQPEVRLKELQAGSPDMLTLCCVVNKDVELVLHERLKDTKHHSEWFKNSMELQKVIQEYSASS